MAAMEKSAGLPGRGFRERSLEIADSPRLMSSIIAAALLVNAWFSRLIIAFRCVSASVPCGRRVALLRLSSAICGRRVLGAQWLGALAWSDSRPNSGPTARLELRVVPLRDAGF
jgi:hypothetical protein